MSKKLKVFSDYIFICPDKPMGGSFDPGGQYVEETGVVEDVGPKVSEEVKKLKGQRIVFNAWACDKKTVNKKDYYFTPESANAICATF